jgi:hypothetical protein
MGTRAMAKAMATSRVQVNWVVAPRKETVTAPMVKKTTAEESVERRSSSWGLRATPE